MCERERETSHTGDAGDDALKTRVCVICLMKIGGGAITQFECQRTVQGTREKVEKRRKGERGTAARVHSQVKGTTMKPQCSLVNKNWRT